MQSTARENGMTLKLISAVEAVNDAQKHVLVDKIIGRLGSELTGRRIAIWGLAFKPDTDDLREKENRQKFCERQRKRIGKQDVENAGSDHPIECGDRDLGNEEPERRQIEFPLTDAHRLAADGNPEEIGRRGDQQNDSQNANGVEREMNRRRYLRWRGDEQSSA